MMDTGTDAKSLPAFVLESPVVASAIFAKRTPQHFFFDFDASPHVIAERVLATVPEGMSPG